MDQMRALEVPMSPNDTTPDAQKFPAGKGIIRVEKRGGFTVLDNTAATDPRLSFKALGIHTYLMTRVDSWQVYAEQLAKTHTDGVDSVYSGLRELESAGYLERRTLRDEKGRIIGRESVVYETPRPGFTVTGKTPDTGKPCHGKSQTNKYLLSTNTDLQQEKTLVISPDGEARVEPETSQEQRAEEQNTPPTCQEPTETAGKGTGQGNATSTEKVPGAAARLLAIWNEHCGALPKAEVMTKARETALNGLSKAFGDAAPALMADAVREVALDAFWKERRYGLDNLLRGKVPAKAEAWRARKPSGLSRRRNYD